MNEAPENVSRSLWARRLKRGFDVSFAVAGLAVGAPLLGAVAIAVRLSSPGPVFFVQKRAGRGGRPFGMLKFRSMSVRGPDDPAIDAANTGQRRDLERVTRLGERLRRFKLDELPQLWNVLVGDMSVVGPRPTPPEQAERYDAFRRRRLNVRPGLTGLAQVNGAAGIPWDDRIRYDVHYAARHDLRMDLGILLKTPVVVVLGEERFVRPFAESRLDPS